MKRVVQEEEEEASSDDLGRQALPVGAACEGEPMDGLAYLAQVRREASAPRFLVTIAADAVASPAATREAGSHAEPSRLQPVSDREAQWAVAFSGTFARLRAHAAEAADDAQLSALRCGFRGVTEELCRALFAFAARLPDPLSPEAQSDLQVFARKLAATPPEDVCARVALIALSSRLSVW